MLHDMDRWVEAAARLGLSIEPHDDRRHRFQPAGITMGQAMLGLGLRLSRQRSLSMVGSLLGYQDIEAGDPMFDSRFVVKGAPVDRVKSILTPAVCAQLVALQEQVSHLDVRDDRLVAEVPWLVTEPQWIAGALVAIARAAAALTNAQMPGAGPFRG